jgi:hypothetical protein
MQEAVARTKRMCAVMLDTKGTFEVTVRRNPATPRPGAGTGPLRIEADQTVTLTADPAADWSADRPEVRLCLRVHLQ